MDVNTENTALRVDSGIAMIRNLRNGICNYFGFCIIRVEAADSRSDFGKYITVLFQTLIHLYCVRMYCILNPLPNLQHLHRSCGYGGVGGTAAAPN